MRYKGLDLNLLVALDAVFATSSITRASEILNMSQPAVSNALARSREYFQDPLLTMVGRRLQLTPKGEHLKSEIRDLLDRVDRGVRGVDQFDPGEMRRTVSVMLPQAATIQVIPPLFRHLKTVAPHVTIDCIPLDGDPLLLLDQGVLDLVLLPQQYASDKHPSRLISVDPFCCIVDRNAPFGDALTREEYLSAQHVSVRIGSGRKTPLDRQIIEASERRLTDSVSVSDHTQAPWHVVGSNLVATVPAMVAHQFAAVLPIRVLPLPIEIPPVRIVAQWHSAIGLNSWVEWFVEQMVMVSQADTHSET